MRKFLDTFPLHTFLFIFFICFFLYAQNPEQIQLFMMKRTLLIGSLLSLLLFGSVYFFLRNKVKSGIISTLILLLLFNYGILYDVLELLYFSNFWPFKNIHRYLTGIVAILSIAIVWVISKKVETGYKINYFLNLLVSLLLIFNVSKILYFNGKQQYVENDSGKITRGINNTKLPNLYYIILDGYANEHILKKHYNFDNSDFTGFLKNNGFYVADSAISNYYSTHPSVASTLNMDYLPKTTNDHWRERILDNKFFKVLKNNGYTLYRLQSGYSVTSGFYDVDSTVTINGPNEFERGILKFTIFRLDDLFGMIQYARLKSQFEKLDEVAEISKAQRFVFVHIVAPHPPFVFNSKGEHVYNQKHSDNSWEPKSNYVGQLIYVNKIIKTFISQIIGNDKSGVIIVQSDHGPWVQSPDEKVVFESRSMILNAVRYPSLNDSLFNIKMSSVNTFRFFTKHFIDPSVKLLNDSAAGKEEITTNRLFLDRTRQ